MRNALDRLYLFTGYLAGACLIAVFALMMIMSVGRQFGLNIPAGDDFAAWAMAAMAFLGLAHTFKSGELIRMGAVIDRLDGRKRRLAEIAVLILGSLICGYLSWYAGHMVYFSWLLNDMSNGVIAVPLWIPQIAFVVGTSVLLVALLDELVHVATGHAPRYAKAPPVSRDDVLARAGEGSL